MIYRQSTVYFILRRCISNQNIFMFFFFFVFFFFSPSTPYVNLQKQSFHTKVGLKIKRKRRNTEMKEPQRQKTITKTRLFIYTENCATKNRKFSDKKFWYFHISAQNIEYGYSLEPPRRGGSNEYPQSMFLSRNKKNNVYPCKPQFYYIKVGFKGVKII